MPAPTAADLNVLYDASLEFGENWRRPIVERYPWISEENLSHAIAQGVYYVWHGCGRSRSRPRDPSRAPTATGPTAHAG